MFAEALEELLKGMWYHEVVDSWNNTLEVIVCALYEVPKPFCFKYVFGLMDRQTKAMA